MSQNNQAGSFCSRLFDNVGNIIDKRFMFHLDRCISRALPDQTGRLSINITKQQLECVLHWIPSLENAHADNS